MFFSLLPSSPGVYFFLRMSATSSYLYVLEELPSLVFLLLSTQQVLGWARSLHMMRGDEIVYRTVVRRVALWSVGAVAMAQASIYGAYFATQGAVDPDLWSFIASLVHAAAFAGLAGAQFGYGAALRRALRATPLPLAVREHQQRALMRVYALCATAFLLRALLLAGASWADYVDFDQVREREKAEDAAASVVFFTLTEALPMAVVLWSNRGGEGGGGGGGGGSARRPALALLSPISGSAPTPSPDRRSLSPAAARALAFSQTPSPKRRPDPPRATAATSSVLMGLGGMVVAALAPARRGEERAALLGGAGNAGGSAAAGSSYGSGAAAGRGMRVAIAASAEVAAAPPAPE